MPGLSEEEIKEIEMFLRQVSIPCKPIDYLKRVWKEYLLQRYELNNLRNKQRKL